MIKHLVICFSNGNFYKIGLFDDPNEATDAMKRDVLSELDNSGYLESDEEYIGVESGEYESDIVYIDATSASVDSIEMYWQIMQIDIQEDKQ